MITIFHGDNMLYDVDYHHPAASLIAEGNFPPRFSFNPDYLSHYHYGSDLLAGSLMSLTNIAPWNAFNVLALWSIIFSFFATFSLGLKLGGNFFSGFFASILLFFCGPWKYLMTISPQMDDFVSQIGPSFSQHLHHSSTAQSIPLLILVLYLFLTAISQKQINFSSVWLFGLTAILISILSLHSEEMFALLIISVIGVCLIQITKNIYNRKPYKMLLPILGIICIGAILAVFQGGTISDGIHAFNSEKKSTSAITEIKWRSDPGFIYWNEQYDGKKFISSEYPISK